jgi:hypothetical protein
MARLTPPIGPLRDEQGLALPLVLMLLVLISGLALAFLSMSGLEVVVAQNHDAAQRAFHIADAGIEHARAVLPDTDIAGVVAAGGNLFNAVALGGGSYSVNLSENPDGTYFLTSTGLYKDASRSLRALASAGGLPAARAAVEILTNGTSYKINAEGSSLADGRDWLPPADMTTCGASATCGTVLSDSPTTYGAFRNNAGVVVDVNDGGTIYGTDCLSGVCGGSAASASVETDTSVPLTHWDGFLDGAVPKANQTLTGSDLANATKTYTLGTPTAPQITVVKTGTNIDWKAKVNGAGVLIIENNSSGCVCFGGGSGTLNWQGLVIIRSSGAVNFDLPNSTPRVRIFGQFVNRSAASAGIHLEYTPNFVKYSSAAMNIVRRQFLSVQGWQEVAQ